MNHGEVEMLKQGAQNFETLNLYATIYIVSGLVNNQLVYIVFDTIHIY